MNPSDLHRLNTFYAHRVRYLIYDETDPEERVVAQSLHLTGTFTLPNLVELHCSGLPNTFIPSLRIFWGLPSPRIRQITLYFCYEDDDGKFSVQDSRSLQTLLSSLPILAPKLHSLTLEGAGGAHTGIYPHSLEKALTSVGAQLRHLDLDEIELTNTELRQILSSAHSLQTMHASLIESPTPLQPATVLPTPIKTLSLQISSTQNLTELLRFLRLPCLTSFSSTLRHLNPNRSVLLTSASIILKLGVTIRDCCMCPLTSFSFTEHLFTGVQPSKDDSLVSDGILEPFLSFANISDFHISLFQNSTTKLEIGGGFMHKMVLAWPNLRRLSLNSNINPAALPRLEDLICLLAHCQGLCFLSLSFDFSRTRCSLDNIHTFITSRGSGLLELQVGSSIVSDPTLIAAYLTACRSKVIVNTRWSSLRHRHVQNEHRQNVAKWEEVNTLVKVFSQIREHERKLLPIA